MKTKPINEKDVCTINADFFMEKGVNSSAVSTCIFILEIHPEYKQTCILATTGKTLWKKTLEL